MEFNLQLQMTIPVNYLQEDFKEIEVKKNLAVHGDDMLVRIKREFVGKAYKFGNLFSHRHLYVCKGVENGNAIFDVICG